jgi:sulfate/thiosulfate transport system ATP-binding protein
VFQHYALFKHMTVFDNVAFGMRMKPRGQRPSEAKIRDKVHELLNLVQLDWLADRFPSQLSGGQRQRIALARALAVEPRVLLLDEPFGALDAKVRKELRRWLRKLHDELHITSIFVTHDQEEALEVADRVVLMDHGKVEQIGTPEEVYRHPATPFVYGFLGSVNFFHGRVDGESVRLVTIRCHKPMTSITVPKWSPLPGRMNWKSTPIPRRPQALPPASTACWLWRHGAGRARWHQRFERAAFRGRDDRQRVLELGLHDGQDVRLVPSRLKVFEREGALT